MEKIVSYTPDSGIIVTELQGQVTLHDVGDLIDEVLPLAAKYNCYLFLDDARAATSIGMSMMEIYFIPQLVAEKALSMGIPPYKLNRALVASRSAEILRFFEDASNDRMQLNKVFLDMEAAKKWLLSKRLTRTPEAFINASNS